MKKVIRLTETDLEKIVKRVISEQGMLPLKYKLQSAFETNTKGKAVEGSDNDLTTLVTLLPSKPTALDQKTHPRKGVLPPANKIYSISTANNGDFDFFQFKPGGYFNTHNWVVQTQGGKSRLGTFDVNGKKIYFKKFGVPQNQWYKDEGFTEVVDLGSLTGKSDNVTKEGGTTYSVVDIVRKYIGVGGVKKSSVSGVEAAFKQFPKSRVYYIIDPKTNAKRYFQYNVDGTKLTKRGTWSIENDKIVYDKVKTPTNTQTETPPPPQNRRQYTQAPDSADVMNGSTTLKQYQMGPLVGRIQRLLGFPTTDDKFGPKTLAALVSFQDKNEITDERGFVGPKTLTALERISQPIQGLASKGLKNVLPTQDNQTPVIAQNQDLGVDDFS